MSVLGGAPTQLTTAPTEVGAHLAQVYRAALRNLVELNTGTDAEGRRLIRAGGGYAEPWTRDAAINAWSAASLLEPAAARDTLLAVCARSAQGELVIQQDDQWWDQAIWVIAAWRHHLVTGDQDFLVAAYGIASASLRILERDRYDHRIGLYRGPAVMQDGISGYPEPPYAKGNDSSFVLDHPHAHTIMCLSTNAVYAEAHRAAADMADVLGAPGGAHRARSESVRAAINARLWIEPAGRYGYFRHNSGPLSGAVDDHQETLGLALAVLFGVADPSRAESVLANTHRQPRGVVNVWPPFPRFDAEHPGRHNAICWPMVMAMWAMALAEAGRVDQFAGAVEDLLGLFTGSGGELYEVYNAVTGAVDGGWQQGWHWESQPHQTWSASTFLGVIHHGLFGLRFAPAGLGLRPRLPAEWAPLTLSGVRYRMATLDITLTGSGDRVSKLRVDGCPVERPEEYLFPADARGRHDIRIELEARAGPEQRERGPREGTRVREGLATAPDAADLAAPGHTS